MSRNAVFGLTIVLAVLLACNLPSDAAPASSSEVSSALVTAAAQTASAALALTQSAAGVSSAPTQPPAAPVVTATLPPAPPPTATPTLTPSPLPTATPLPTMTLTPTPSTPHISVSVNTNCRTGPGDAYDRVGALLVGETAEVLARDPYGLFWYIPNPDNPGGKCWVWGQYATITGETSSLPVFTPPPTPTPAPAFVIKNVELFTSCVGDAFYIEVSNTGQVPWQSYRVDVTDLDTSATDVDRSNGFADANVVCGPFLDLDALAPGQGGYIFYYNIGDATHRMRFTVTLYTGDNQSGQYLTHTIDYTP